MKDELVAVGETIYPTELVRIALSGFSKNWVVFVDGIVSHENLLGWERLWDDFILEEIIRGSKNGGQHNGDDEENVSFNKGQEKVQQERFQGWEQAEG